ncbi:hypothetical protein FEM03_22630 [Phragmitibacter flavus]|uniref:Uncharacterized protein n=1 Tax=Phragmitibacter flavus TaxID=2576071 RepID=A0A5R8K8Y3_9BACT|nr:hypothetical protein [Phragmitibacter flavus]TLD68405.1 hypothetical protein FEM03_22630 [Phragmitibacter flavus]
MSAWRRKASEYLPELQSTIASPVIDNPMYLWTELQSHFSRLCTESPPNIDLLTRFWHYSQWCLRHPNPNIQTAAAIGFCGHLLDTHDTRSILPKIISREEYISLKSLLLYHNTEADHLSTLTTFPDK